MTDVYLQKKLVDAFLSLNSFSGVQFLNDKNVSLPNKAFVVPTDKRWFAVSFMAGEPSPAAAFDEAQNRWNGVLQIDIQVPLDKGEAEANNKYEWIAKLFRRGNTFDEIEIVKCYRTNQHYTDDQYVTTVRVEWTADIDN